MIIVLKPGTNETQFKEIMTAMEALGMEGRVLGGDSKMLIHVISGPTRPARRLLALDRVQALVPTSGPRIRAYGRRFYPFHFLGWCAGFLLLFGVLVFMAGMFPPGLGAEVDVRTPPTDMVAPWYLAVPHAFLKIFPESYSVFAWPALLLLVLLFFCLPLLDRTTGTGIPQRFLVIGPGLLVLLGLAYLAFREVIL